MLIFAQVQMDSSFRWNDGEMTAVGCVGARATRNADAPCYCQMPVGASHNERLPSPHPITVAASTSLG